MREKISLKKVLKALWLIYGVFSVFIVLYLVDQVICNGLKEASEKVILDNSWTITMNGEVYENRKLDSFLFDSVNKGDVIVIETTIPDDIEYRNMLLCIQNPHTTVSMYVDEKLEYEYGYDRSKENKATGSGYLFIDFYEEYKGKKLKLEYTATEDSAFSRLNEPWISKWEDGYRYVVTENRLPLFMGSFLVVFGVMMTIVQIFAVVISTKYRNVLLLAIFSICMGLWTLCYYDVVMIFAIPLYKISLIEHMALFIAPLPLIGYMYTYVKETDNKNLIRVYYVLFSVQMALTVISIILHMIDIAHGAEMLKYFLIMFMIHLLFITYVLYLRKRSDKALSKITFIGLSMVLGCIFYELASYILSRHIGYHLVAMKGVSSVGLTIFIGILVVDLYLKVTKNMMEEHEKDLLVKRAYVDELTQIHNRTYCSEYMEKLGKDSSSKYTIINFDLNGLKKMNDTYGHVKGDELICCAAKVLDKTFSADGVVGRMGGDEFIAIIENDESELIEQLIEKLLLNIQEINEEKPELALSISYGYATNKEIEDANPEKIYQIADERMYEYKQRVKKNGW